MQQHIIFISTRQLVQLDFDTYPLPNATRSLILSEQELKTIGHNIIVQFHHIEVVPIISSDNVVFEYDPESVITAISSISKPEQQLSIVCFDEGNTVTAAYVRYHLSLSSSHPEQAKLFKNKILMKQKLLESGIKVPNFIALTHSHKNNFKSLVNALALPFVIKPAESAGSNNIYIIKNESTFKSTIEEIAEEITAYEAETFIEGKLYHCDIAIYNEKVIFSQCTEYLAPTIDFQSGIPLGGKIMDYSSPHREALITFTKSAINSLNGGNGVYHTEIFIEHDGTPVFLEAGARAPGMLVTRMYQKATNINLLNLDVAIQTGLIEKQASDHIWQQSFYAVYPKKKGTVTKITPEPLDLAVDYEYQCYAKVGDTYRGCSSNLDFIATVICSGKGNDFEDSLKIMANFEPASY